MVDIRVVGAGGEYMESVVVVEWHKAVGDAVKPGDLVVTVETAKAATEIEASEAGILVEIAAAVGAEVEIGALLGRIAAEGETIDGPAPDPQPAAASVPPPPQPDAPAAVAASPGKGRLIVSPLARRLAAMNDVDLAAITPSSPSGRIKRRDIEAALAAGKQAATVPQAPPAIDLPAIASPAIATGATYTGALHMLRRGGEGTPLVLLHGFGSESGSWRPLLTALKTRRPVIAIDLPGHGRSPAMPASGLRALALAIEAALVEDGISQLHLAGHSLGGGLALALLESGRLDIRSLCLLAPAGLGTEIDGTFLSGFARASRRESLEPWLRRLVADESLVTPAFVTTTLAARASADLRQAQADLADLLFPDGTQVEILRDAARLFHGPQRIVWGLQDRIIPWKHAVGFSPRAGLHLLPGVGHMPQLEAVELVAAIMREVIDAAGETSP